MATRSTVGYTKKNGEEAVAVYCHWDGYPSAMVPAIERFIALKGVRKFMAEIRRGVKQGGIRSVSANTIETYGDMRNETSEGDEFLRTRNEIDLGQYDEYCYLVDSKTGKITEFYDHKGQQSLETMRSLVDE